MANSNLRFNRDEINDELQKKGVVTREITPSPNFMTILESVGYRTSEALSDITDNSVDAEATKIITYFSKENNKPYIVIGDNGTGMEPDVLFGALVLGANEFDLGNKVKNGGSLGKYGTGMKSSILSLKGIATIITKADGGEMVKTEYHRGTVQEYFDKNNAWGISIEKANKEDRELFEQYTEGSEHGTVIKIHNIERFKDVQSIRNTMIKTYARYFHRFITSGVKIVVNDAIIEPIDLSGYEVPFTLNGESHSSKQLGTDREWDNLTYIDKHGVKHKDGYLRYRAFLLPQQDVLFESAWIDKFDWTIGQQGICIYRGNRMIQSRGWLGLSAGRPQLNRFRVELDFNGDLDGLMNPTFTKISVDPDGSILKLIDGVLKRDIATATEIFNAASNNSNKISKSLNQLAKRFSNWAKNNANLLPKIPKTSSKIKLNRKPRTTTHTVTGKKMKTVGDRLRFIFDDQIYDGSFYKTETSGRYNNCLDIYWNINHVMVKKFVEKADPYTLSPLVCMIWGEHFGKECNKPDSSAKKLNEFNEMWDRIQVDKGNWLAKMYPTTPKV